MNLIWYDTIYMMFYSFFFRIHLWVVSLFLFLHLFLNNSCVPLDGIAGNCSVLEHHLVGKAITLGKVLAIGENSRIEFLFRLDAHPLSHSIPNGIIRPRLLKRYWPSSDKSLGYWYLSKICLPALVVLIDCERQKCRTARATQHKNSIHRHRSAICSHRHHHPRPV